MKYTGITMGDPCGIGAEVILKAVKSNRKIMEDTIIFGNYDLLNKYNDEFKLEIPIRKIENSEDFKEGFLNVIDPRPIDLKNLVVGQVTSLGGECAFIYVKTSIEYAMEGKISSVVTAPLNKEALHLAGYKYAGHTEIFADLSGGDSYAMVLWSDKLRVIHTSTHVALREACNRVKKERVMEVIHLADKTLKKSGYESPKIAVAGLNPHSGEGGIFGREEIEEIEPAIAACKAEGINVSGPVAPDTVFLKALKGEYDMVVVHYHDQGHIPLKLLAFDSGVNITVGLDVVRTSVDHGTAFDIAGKMIASEESMLKAIEMGRMLV